MRFCGYAEKRCYFSVCKQKLTIVPKKTHRKNHIVLKLAYKNDIYVHLLEKKTDDVAVMLPTRPSFLKGKIQMATLQIS